MVSVLAGLVVGVFLALVRIDTVVADIEYDWLAARAAISSDAYMPVKELAEAEGVSVRIVVPLDGSPSIHPRTPGALLLMLPLGLVPFSLLVPLATATSVAAWTAFCMFWLRDDSGRPTRRLLLLLVASIGAPIMMTFSFAGQGLIVGALLYAAWVRGSQGRAHVVPAAMAAAATVLRVFPGALILLWLRRRQTRLVLISVAMIVGLNALGLLLPGVSFASAVETLSQSAKSFMQIPTNATLAGVLTRLGLSTATAAMLSYSLLVLWFVVYLSGRIRDSFGLLLVGTLLLMPVAWTSYDVVLVPFALCLAGAGMTATVARATPLILWGVLTACWIGREPLLLWTSTAARASAAAVIACAALWLSLREGRVGMPAMIHQDLVGPATEPSHV